MSRPKIADEIERYLRTGDSDDMATAWPVDLMDRGRQQNVDLRRALVGEVRRLAKGLTHESVPADVGAAFTRARIETRCAASSRGPSKTPCSRRSISRSCT